MRKLIYIDDEIINLNLFHLNFRDKFEIITTENPEKAIQLIRDHNIKVILTDYKMPGMNGMELIDHVKSFAPETVCMIITGFPETEVIIDKTKLFRFIMKPFIKSEVTDLLEEAFSLACQE